jgi:hypothetical protein
MNVHTSDVVSLAGSWQPIDARNSRRAHELLLWVLQILLAMAFFAHGLLLLLPPARLQEMAKVMPDWFRLLLGAAELLGLSGSRSQASRAFSQG